MLDIIYSTETKEILTGSIITTQSVSADEQYSFIRSMSKVLCPEASATEVEAWVNANIGGYGETTIDDVDYQLDFGQKNNALYYAGQHKWEEWELTHN